MEIFNTLASVGLDNKALQLLIVGGVALFIIGMYWRIIVAGAAVLFCVGVFAMGSGSSTSAESDIDISRKKDFMQDCMHYEGDKKSCEAIWNERENFKP
jgi:cell division protein FtsW (lipid II flippase)